MEIDDDADYVKASTRLVVEGKGSVVRPKKTWKSTLCQNVSAES